ncbi:hypothetical protein BpHYR1_000381 [Brachionus plicatilis]|uniref:Uncharacterized protein n=1 Tax=Brachionus plicatilis TaxID=10195 RepID=A0A3M7Q4Y3_BRAPC|nr:hypothetical protein BpHYR1_000381 [Brachionus plicatilis]
MFKNKTCFEVLITLRRQVFDSKPNLYSSTSLTINGTELLNHVLNYLSVFFMITTLCNFQSCISYQGLQNSANLAEIRFLCDQEQCILKRFCTSFADFERKLMQLGMLQHVAFTELILKF